MESVGDCGDQEISSLKLHESWTREVIDTAPAFCEVLLATNSQSLTNTITPDVEAGRMWRIFLANVSDTGHHNQWLTSSATPGTPVYEGSLRYKTVEALFDVSAWHVLSWSVLESGDFM